MALAGFLALSGCQDDPTSPSGGESEPSPAMEVGAAASAPLPFRQITAGLNHSCGITTEGRAYCWGSNGSGQLGDGTTALERTRPVAVATSLRFQMLSAGTDFTCGVATDYRAYCWGLNYDGTLGDGTTTSRRTPVLVAGARLYRQVRAGHRHTCGVTRADVAFCWGFNKYGQVGDGSDLDHQLKPVPVAGGMRFRQVTPGSLHTCGATLDNRAFCWGAGIGGEIGDGKTFQRRTPRAVAGGISFLLVHAGGDFRSCGVSTLGKAYCWGDNSDGELGDGTTTRRLTPTPVAGGFSFSDVSPGVDHTCGTTKAAVGKCWGANFRGQLGDGTTTRRLRPATVAGGLQFAPGGISASNHTCGLTTGNRAYCWGGNQFGQLGDGTLNTVRLRPVPVVGP